MLINSLVHVTVLLSDSNTTYKVHTTYCLTNGTVVLKLDSNLYVFLFLVEESSKRTVQTFACPCRKYVGGYTARVCV